MARFQKSTATLFNRYSEVFLTIREGVRQIYGEDLGGESLRILSFGCSIGAEILTARAYFPDATILGCDIDKEALAEASAALSDDSAVIFYSDPGVIKSIGAIDIILANSVFCDYPLDPAIHDLNRNFPFSAFEDHCGTLLEVLSDTGFLVLYNTNYRFFDLPDVSGFKSFLSPRIEANGFVDKFDRQGKRLTRTRQIKGQRTYYHEVLSESLKDDDLRDCIFTRNDLAESEEMYPSEQSDLEAQLILGIDPSTLENNKIAAGLFAKTIEKDGFFTKQLEWRKRMLDGEIKGLGRWVVKAGPSLPDFPTFQPENTKRGRFYQMLKRR